MGSVTTFKGDAMNTITLYFFNSTSVNTDLSLWKASQVILDMCLFIWKCECMCVFWPEHYYSKIDGHKSTALKTQICHRVTFMMWKLFILVFAGTACMCSSATPASPKNFNDTLSGLLQFSWMLAKCPRKLFLRAGVATWRMAPLLCQVSCNRRTQARLCASS